MAEPSEVPEFTLAVEGRRGKAVRLSISGHISLDNLVPFRSELASILSRMVPGELTVDLAGVKYLDSAAALALLDLKGDAEALTIPFTFENASEEIRGVMGLIDPEALTSLRLVTHLVGLIPRKGPFVAQEKVMAFAVEIVPEHGIPGEEDLLLMHGNVQGIGHLHLRGE